VNAHSLADRIRNPVSSGNMPAGDLPIADAASSPSQSSDLAQVLERASVVLTDVLALPGNNRPDRTLRNEAEDWFLKKPMHDLVQVDDLLISLGGKDLTQEGKHYANAPK
jgi:hypothetical protein